MPVLSVLVCQSLVDINKIIQISVAINHEEDMKPVLIAVQRILYRYQHCHWTFAEDQTLALNNFTT